MTNPHLKSKPDIVGIILSGGAGRRIGGLDKGLQMYMGKPLIEHVLDSLSTQVNSLVLCINRNQEAYSKYGYPLVTDIESVSMSTEKSIREHIDKGAIYQGPMAGVVAVAQWLGDQDSEQPPDYILLSSCDSPCLPINFSQKLLDAIEASDRVAAVANDGNRNQNLHSLIRFTALKSLQKFYASGGRAMHHWYSQEDAIQVDFSDQAEAFLNINSREQLG